MKYFNYNQFSLEEIIRRKREQRLTVGIALPVLDEEATLEKTINSVKKCGSLIDEFIVIDSGSIDNSKNICDDNGILFIDGKKSADVLKEEYKKGKGWNLWASLYYLNTDIIIWIDSDIQNVDERFIIGVVAPMVMDKKIKFVKGYYERPKGDARVTEIMVRPFVSLFLPKLKNIIQPLSGEYGGQRKFLEKINFYSGYSVEMGILIQALYGLRSHELSQVYLGKRIHELQEVPSLGRMSASILKTMVNICVKLDIIKTMKKNTSKLRQFKSANGKNFYPIDIDIVDKILPKMIDVKKYNEKFKK